MFSLGVLERKVLSLHYKQLNMAKKKDNTTSIGFEDAIWRAADKLSDFDKFIEGLDSK